jgi:integrase
LTRLHSLSSAFLKSAKPGKHNDGSGLWFHKRADGGAQWVLRVVVHGRRREMGLGGYPAVGLRDARSLASQWREQVILGNDPLKVRNNALREAARNDHLLKTVALAAFEAKKAELKGDGKAGRWFSPLQHHVLPKLGKVPVEDINQQDIAETLAVIWHDKADTARKAINRLNLVMKYGAAMGLDVDLGAIAKAKALLGKSRHRPQNIPSLHWKAVPAFYESLSEVTITHLALRLLILTGVRTNALRHISFSQIQNNTWTVPAQYMKGTLDKASDFDVPLSKEALRVIDLARPFAVAGNLFSGTRKGVISDAAMSRLMERRDMSERPHGFRSSLRTWLAECTNAPEAVAESVLAHASGNKVVRAYKRTDFFEQRLPLMERWAQHVVGDSNVERMPHARSS